MKPILEKVFWGNSLYAWLIALGMILALIVAIKLFSYVIIRRIRAWSLKTSSTWDDYLISVLDRFIVPLLYISSVYAAVHTLHMSAKVHRILYVAFLLICTYFVFRLLSSAFRRVVTGFVEKQGNAAGKMQQANGLIIIANVLIWVVGSLFLIDNLGYDVTTLLAGLGIGGIAIALAAQAILGDLFSYFVIFFDRPFEIGDFIILDDKSGTIEKIGIKTTRIRTLGGEQLICSNTDLTNARVHNYKRLERRRVLFTIGVTYQTPYEQLAKIPDLVRTIIEREEGVEFERGNFSAFGDFSLNFEFVYHVLSSDYVYYMDKQQAIYFAIYQAFSEQGIEFAYPTQTLFVQTDPSSHPKHSVT